jgi:hypothetical protein
MLLAAPELDANIHLIVFSAAPAGVKTPLTKNSVKAPTKINENIPFFENFISTSLSNKS